MGAATDFAGAFKSKSRFCIFERMSLSWTMALSLPRSISGIWLTPFSRIRLTTDLMEESASAVIGLVFRFFSNSSTKPSSRSVSVKPCSFIQASFRNLET